MQLETLAKTGFIVVVSAALLGRASVAHGDSCALDASSCRSAKEVANDDPSLRYFPSLGLGLGASNAEGYALQFWVGLSMDRKRSFGPSIGLGAEIDIRGLDGDDSDAEEASKAASPEAGADVEVWPVVRVGMSYSDGDALIPIVRMYSVLGFRPGARDYRYRLGMGLAIPPLLPLAEAGIPNTIELSVDGGDASPRLTARMGWSF